ncbi:PepSY domain-containing protein [Kangiella sediminilitoris]|uniref:PepSY-associated TM helix domain protein n=1 Tax=Kangiella sediminilitoris TaxID=1144748 RepID=A0A1B3B9J4_9GAMM|nr:PepSY domain-containing protein [Kangiella sediminilitoris]AOE49460.1 hypothetical protein KS2013_736 [Kangiella sediminilitoris]
MKKKKHSSNNNRKGHYRKWHRRFGVAASIFLLNLAVTGLLLNHYEALKLHQSYITSDWLMDWYGIESPESVNCLQSKQKRVCQIGDQIYLNETFWKEQADPILLFKTLEQESLLITSSHAFWLTKDLALIEDISFAEELGNTISSAGFINDQLTVETTSGKGYQFNSDFFSWEQTNSAPTLKRQAATEPTPALKDTLSNGYRHRQITHLRFVQDLHSGAVIGLSGKITNDLTALIIIWLVISGFITWYRRKNKK